MVDTPLTTGGSVGRSLLKKEDKIFVAGHRGLVGSSICRFFSAQGFVNVCTADRSALDLTDQASTHAYLRSEKPAVVVVAAARVGGIYANDTYPADFLYDNVAIATNLIKGSLDAGVSRLLFLGSACIYPKFASQPIREEELLSGSLEPTNEPYALAKIAALKFCQSIRRQHGLMYHSLMPNNLYGPGDNYHPENSHVIPGMLRRLHEAARRGDQEVIVWGTGKPRREFLYVDDLARAVLHVLQLENPPDWVNAGTGEDISIGELARMIAEVVGFKGELVFDHGKPDGAPRKLLDVSRLQATGWRAETALCDGLRLTYEAFLHDAAHDQLRR